MIEYQRLILGDTIRNTAFVQALKAVIRPGQTTIADIGSGTGFLSFIARKLGAKECHLYEVSDLLSLSKKIAQENNIDHCQFHHAFSTQVKKPPKVDLVISETLGNYALEENITEILSDARRFLKPGGIIIPQMLRQYIAPVITSRLHRELDIWDDVPLHLDFKSAREVSLNNMYVKRIDTHDLYSSQDAIREWDMLDFREDNDSIRESELTWRLDHPRTIYGFALWWEAELVSGITVSTDPSSPPTHWQQIYLPLLHPLSLKDEEEVSLRLTSDSRFEVKINLAWHVEHRSRDGSVLRAQSLDMRRGLVI